MTTVTRSRKPVKVNLHLRSFSRHPMQRQFVLSPAKRKIIQAGRRGGKTVGVSQLAIKVMMSGKRVLYAVPVAEQVEAFWYEVKRALRELIDAKLFKCNETEHSIEREGTKQRIRAKTAWNADTLRGDYADLLILDEYQLMSEDAWELVGAPMLLDNDGDAVFIYTPISAYSKGNSRARDPLHASKLYRKYRDGHDPRWATFHFTSHDNGYISAKALAALAGDMSQEAIRREILAEDDDQEWGRLVYGGFHEDRQMHDRFEVPKTWPRMSMHDFGTVNPAALFVAQNPGPGIEHGILPGDYLVYSVYFPGPGRSTQEHVIEWQEMCKGLEVVRRVGGNKTTEEEIRQGYGACGWPIAAPKWSQVNVQIDRVIRLMEHDRIHIFRDLYPLREEMANCLWDVDNEGNKLDKVANESRYHLLAALRYGMSDMPQEAIVQKKQQTVMHRFGGR